jgi:hypothetical protein
MEEARREMLAQLLERVAVPVDEAQDLIRDDDEWVAESEVRLYIPEEELVEEWKYAVDQLSHLATAAAGGGLFGSVVVAICLADVEERAEEALRRARERARQTQAKPEE